MFVGFRVFSFFRVLRSRVQAFQGVRFRVLAVQGLGFRV